MVMVAELCRQICCYSSKRKLPPDEEDNVLCRSHSLRRGKATKCYVASYMFLVCHPVKIPTLLCEYVYVGASFHCLFGVNALVMSCSLARARCHPRSLSRSLSLSAFLRHSSLRYSRLSGREENRVGKQDRNCHEKPFSKIEQILDS